MTSFIGFIPTEPEFVEGFFKLVTISPSDTVYDLGCGDGRLLFAAIERGAGKGVGIDLNSEPIYIARQIAANKKLEDRITFIHGEIEESSLSDATIIFCYLFDTAMLVLKPKFERELKSGTRVVSEMFPVPGWKPLRTFDAVDETGYGYRMFYLYVMPQERSE